MALIIYILTLMSRKVGRYSLLRSIPFCAKAFVLFSFFLFFRERGGGEGECYEGDCSFCTQWMVNINIIKVVVHMLWISSDLP